MKTIYLIGGTMGVGKTTVCQRLKKQLCNAVFLDGDWCWDAAPFQVTDETKTMVLDNIRFMLNSFIHCSAYDNIIFCWVMHEQSIIDTITEGLDTENCTVIRISLTVDEINLKSRLSADIENGIRTPDIIEKSICRIGMYKELDTIKIDNSQFVTLNSQNMSYIITDSSFTGNVELHNVAFWGDTSTAFYLKGSGTIKMITGLVHEAGKGMCSLTNGKLYMYGYSCDSTSRIFEIKSYASLLYVTGNRFISSKLISNKNNCEIAGLDK